MTRPGSLLLREVRLPSGGPPTGVRIVDERVVDLHAGKRRESGERVVDGRGGTLLPGLVDAHVQAVQWATSRRRTDASSARSAQEAAVLMRRAALETGCHREDLLLGYGFRDALWPDVPHKDLLEAVLPGQPVVLLSNDLHAAWLSPAALALIGWPDHPTGVLLEQDALTATAALPAASPAQVDRLLLEATYAAAARGVTGIIDFEYADNSGDWTRRFATGPPAVRVSATVQRFALTEAIARGQRTGDVVPGSAGLLTVGPAKLFVDGSLNTRTAYCHEPYPDQDPPAHGRLELAGEELLALMSQAAEHGLHPAVHAIGDHAVTIALDAFERLGCAGRIEHAQLVDVADIRRAARTGRRRGRPRGRGVRPRDPRTA